MRSFILTGLIIFVLLPIGLVSLATAQDGLPMENPIDATPTLI